MAKSEGRQILAEAKKAGREYATESLEGEFFLDYVSEQIYSADIDDLPENKKEALRTARNFLIDLYNDSSRNMGTREILQKAGVGHTFSAYGAGYVQNIYGIDSSDVEHAFWEGFHLVIDRKTAQNWLADEILYRSRERRGEAA